MVCVSAWMATADSISQCAQQPRVALTIREAALVGFGGVPPGVGGLVLLFAELPALCLPGKGVTGLLEELLQLEGIRCLLIQIARLLVLGR